MSKWSEKDMDKLFQQGSEQYDFEYDPVAWQDMEQLLERAERRRRWFWWWFGAAIALAIVLLAANHFFSNEEERMNAPEGAEVLSEIGEADARGRALRDKSDSSVEAGTKPKLPEARAEGAEKKENANTGIKPSGAFPSVENMQPSLLENSTDEGQGPVASDKVQGRENEYRPSPKSISIPDSNAEAEASEKGASMAGVPPIEPRLTGIALLPTLKIWVEKNPAEKNGPSIPFDSVEMDVLNKITSLGSPAFLLGLTGGAEWNSVGFGDFTQRNWKFGVHGEYRFRENFGFGLGVTWMRMDYDAGKNEYVPEQGFWVDGIAPESTFGRCDMLEIPLDFSYHVNGFRQDGIFISAGLSSYWILEEHYWYSYDAPRPDLVFYWGTQKDERNFLSLGHISFAYQKRFSPKTSFSFGPYAQFPLVGVGHGAVKIFTVGLRLKADFWAK